MFIIIFLLRALWLDFIIIFSIMIYWSFQSSGSKDQFILLLPFLKMYFFIYLWLRRVSIAVRVLCVEVIMEGYSIVAVLGLLVAVASLVAEHGL